MTLLICPYCNAVVFQLWASNQISFTFQWSCN